MQTLPANWKTSFRAHLQENLFPLQPRQPLRLERIEAAGLLVAVFALAVILQLLRVGPTEALDSLWAEDGQIFLQGAINGGFLHSLFQTYAGYLVFVPRLIGETGGLVPLRDAAAAIAIASGLVVAISGLVVWFASAALIRNPYLRGTLVALTILSPVANLESVASGAYVPWYMLFATFWLLLWRPRSAGAAGAGGVFALATGLSSPGVWFFAPLAVLRSAAARDRRDGWILAGYWIGAAVQIPVIAFNTEEAVEPLWTSDIWTAYIQRAVNGATFGERLGGVAWAHLGWPFLILLLACLALALVAGLRRAAAPARWLAAVAIPISLVMFVFSVYQRAVGAQMAWPEGIHFGNGGRYAIVPALLLVSVALVMVDGAPRTRLGRDLRPWVAGGVVALLLAGMAISFDVRDVEGRGTPLWTNALDAAHTSCETEHLTATTVPTSPPGFGVVVPCDQLP